MGQISEGGYILPPAGGAVGPGAPHQMPSRYTKGPGPEDGPPIGSVVSFEIAHPGGLHDYSYAAIRAGNGLWYVTGGETKQGIIWSVMMAAIQPRLRGPVSIMIAHRHYYP